MSGVKCVVWDLDGTLWDGIAVETEGPGLPPLFPDVIEMLDKLESRGIASSIASRNSEPVAEALARLPGLAGRFLAPQLGWGDKSDSLVRIAGELGIGLDALAVVDDSPYERAEIRERAPEVLVLSPEELRASIDEPPFVPEHVSPESHLRVARLRDEAARKAAQTATKMTREEFLESCRMELSLTDAGPEDVDRLVELAGRARRLSSSGLRMTAAEVAARIDDPDWRVVSARLVDRFGDYGSIGAAFVQRAGVAGTWRLPFLAVSCRVAGKGVAEAMLATIVDRARATGASEVAAEVRDTRHNLELRVLLKTCGFRAVDRSDDGTILLTRAAAEPGPDVPRWITVTDVP